MTMGDSLSNGLNSDYILDSVTNDPSADSSCPKSPPQFEIRGASFATGGDNGIFSVGSAFKKFNNDIVGLSHGNTPLSLCYGPVCPAGTILLPFNSSAYGLNAAQSGAWVNRWDIDNQLKYYDEFYSSFVPETADPWKLMIMTFGANNQCLACIDWLNKHFFTADTYEEVMRTTIEKLRKKFDKMVVILEAPFSLSKLVAIEKTSHVCETIRNMTSNREGCRCIYDEKALPQIDALAAEYTERLKLIAADYRSANYSTFAVVYDPGMYDTDLSKASAEEIIGGLDCFHGNVLAHQRLAVSLWNNLFKSQDDKTPFVLHKPQGVFCPTESSRIWV